MSIPHESVIQFIQGDEERAKLALLVADAVPRRKEQIEDKAFQGVWGELRRLQLDSGWCSVKRDRRADRRLFLHRQRQDWDPNRNHGVWFKWGSWRTPEKTPGIWVGVEWPLSANLSEAEKKAVLMACFQEHTHEPDPEGEEYEDKEWFALPLGTPEWLNWNTLLAKRDDEIETYAGEAAGVMHDLTKKVDELDP